MPGLAPRGHLHNSGPPSVPRNPRDGCPHGKATRATITGRSEPPLVVYRTYTGAHNSINYLLYPQLQGCFRCVSVDLGSTPSRGFFSCSAVQCSVNYCRSPHSSSSTLLAGTEAED